MPGPHQANHTCRCLPNGVDNVVYKVDRLTRSLANFARLVEIFDQEGCVVLIVGKPATLANISRAGPRRASRSARKIGRATVLSRQGGHTLSGKVGQLQT